MEFTLLGAVIVAVGFIYAVLWYEGGRTNAADCTRDVWDAIITAAIVAVFIGRLVAMIRAGSNPVTHPGDILIVRAGVDTIAASVTGLVTFGFLTRSDPWWLADAAAPAALAGLAGWHAACLARDACLGTATGLPWGVSQTDGGIARHPVEIYTAVLLAVAVVALILWKRRRPRAGVITAIAVAAAAAGRAATEPLRLGLGSDLRWWYVAGAAGALGIAWWRARTGTPAASEAA